MTWNKYFARHGGAQSWRFLRGLWGSGAAEGVQITGRQQLLENMLESSPLGAAISDGEGRVFFANSRLREMARVPLETLLLSRAMRWYADPAVRKELVGRVLAGERVVNAEAEMVRGDASRFPALLSLAPIGLPGDSRFVTWIEDITAQKRIMAELRQASAMAENASRMKSDFLANMSHEIRTPINAVLNLTRLALDSGALAPKQRGFLEKSLMAAESLLALINDVLDLSKIEAGRLELDAQPFQLPRVFAQVTSMLGERANAKGLFLAVAVAPDVPRNLVGDPVRLTQVLINLLANAIKFTERGGIEFRVERLAGDSQRVVLRFCVRDTGIGIAAEKLPHLFAPFVQADASISRQYGGSGLGLVICERLVSLMGGGIEVDSTPGVGSTFSFAAAFAVANDENGATDAVERILDTARLAGRRVLVAEDNPLNQEVIREYLERVGVRVVCVEDGQMAVDRLLHAEMPFDAVLMDMQMPVLDGVAATRRLRAAAVSVPIIAVTANALVEERRHCLDAGMNDYVTKPYEPETLYRALIEQIEASVASPPAASPPAASPPAAPPPTAPPPAVDFDRNALLRISAAAATRARLAGIYLDTLAAAERELGEAVAARDLARLAALCHRVKSSSLTMGANALGQAMAAIDRAARAGDASAVDRAAALPALFAAARAWIQEQIEHDKQGDST